tara:strand:- start:202 stop:807 length:606 start_codon:yes stop_codon:yes gene_type:complete
LSYKKNALKYFKERLNQKVSSEELAQIPGKDGKPISHNIRRIFELRDEEGYDIVNHSNNNETGLDLKVDQWVLRSLEPVERNIRSRQINKRIRSDVLQRDNFTCVSCGRDAQDKDPLSKKNKNITLHIGHIESLHHQIKNKISNSEIKELGELEDFITQCNVCNEGFKNKNIKPLDWIEKIKNLDEKNKLKIYNYLKSIFY